MDFIDLGPQRASDEDDIDPEQQLHVWQVLLQDDDMGTATTRVWPLWDAVISVVCFEPSM